MAEEEVQEEKKGGMLKWIILVVLLVALGAGGYFGYTMFLADGDEAATEEVAGGGTEDGQAPLESLEGILVPLPQFLVNLSDPLGRRYLKLGMEVEVRDEKVMADMDKSQAKIKDTLLLLLSSKTYAQLSTMESKVELKQEVADRLNQILGSGTVLRVYITEMVIQ